jgi:hypothetical protein
MTDYELGATLAAIAIIWMYCLWGVRQQIELTKVEQMRRMVNAPLVTLRIRK